MLLPIRCFTCGLPLSDIEDLFLKKKQIEIDKTLKQGKEIEGIEYREILKEVGVISYCCIMHFIAAMDFSDYY